VALRWQDINHHSSTAIITFLLPHLDTLHDHLPILLPRWQPLILRIPEIPLRRHACINPWLSIDPILKPAIRAADRDIQNEVKVLIERRSVSTGLAPWVDQPRVVGVARGKIALLPKRFLEVRVEHLQQAAVDVGEEVLFAPLETEGMEAGGVG